MIGSQRIDDFIFQVIIRKKGEEDIILDMEEANDEQNFYIHANENTTALVLFQAIIDDMVF